MMNVSSSVPLDAASVQSLQMFAKVLDLLADPTATKAAIATLQKSVAEASALIEKARVESAALVKKRADHAAQMKDDRAALDAELQTKRAAFDGEYEKRERALTEAQNDAKAAQAAAEAERERSLTLNADFESRLSIIHGAATAPLPTRN